MNHECRICAYRMTPGGVEPCASCDQLKIARLTAERDEQNKALREATRKLVELNVRVAELEAALLLRDITMLPERDAQIARLEAENAALREQMSCISKEIIATWRAAQGIGQSGSFRLFERMTDRLGYGRRTNNLPLVELPPMPESSAT